MPYDRHRSAPAIIPVPGITDADWVAFLDFIYHGFWAVGHSKNWDDKTTFTVITHTVPATTATVKFEKLLEWKRAVGEIGPGYIKGGVYRHHDGREVVMLGVAKSEDDKHEHVVYQFENGELGTCRRSSFFEVVNTPGNVLRARFAFVEEAQVASDSKTQVAA